jgi:hypothetical protein
MTPRACHPDRGRQPESRDPGAATSSVSFALGPGYFAHAKFRDDSTSPYTPRGRRTMNTSGIAIAETAVYIQNALR